MKSSLLSLVSLITRLISRTKLMWFEVKESKKLPFSKAVIYRKTGKSFTPCNTQSASLSVLTKMLCTLFLYICSVHSAQLSAVFLSVFFSRLCPAEMYSFYPNDTLFQFHCTDSSAKQERSRKSRGLPARVIWPMAVESLR